MIIIHVIIYLGLLSIIIISHILYASIIIIIDVHLVIFHNSEWIVPGSNTINYNSIPLLYCRRSTPSHKRTGVVATSLWLTFVDKRRGNEVSHQCWYGLSRCAMGLIISWTLGRIGIPRYSPFAYIIIFWYYAIVLLLSRSRFLVVCNIFLLM